MNVQVLTGLDAAAFPDLRNGAITAIFAPSRREAVADTYYFDYVTGSDGEIGSLSVYCALAFGRLVEAQPAPVATTPAAATGNVSHFGDFGITPALASTLRREAIIYGGVRAGSANAYRLTFADLHAAEAGAGPVGTITGGQFTFTTGHTNAARDLTRGEAATMKFMASPLTEDETELYFAMAKLGMGVLPLVGASLMETGHHYLTGQSKSFMALEKQVLANASKAVNDAWNMDTMRSRELAFHKSCHPVATGLMTSLARDVDLPARLNRSGLGAAAVRLPHMEPEIRAAKAYIAVVDSVLTFGGASGFVITVPFLTAMAVYVSSLPDTGIMPAPPQGMTAPADRSAAIRDILKPAVERAAPLVAVAVGMYGALVEEAGSNVNTDSKLTAWSIKKLRTGFVADVATGATAVRSYRAFQRANVEKGQLSVWTLSDAKN